MLFRNQLHSVSSCCRDDEKVILVNAFWVIVITNNTKQALYTIRVLYDVVGDVMLLDAT